MQYDEWVDGSHFRVRRKTEWQMTKEVTGALGRMVVDKIGSVVADTLFVAAVIPAAIVAVVAVTVGLPLHSRDSLSGQRARGTANRAAKDVPDARAVALSESTRPKGFRYVRKSIECGTQHPAGAHSRKVVAARRVTTTHLPKQPEAMATRPPRSFQPPTLTATASTSTTSVDFEPLIPRQAWVESSGLSSRSELTEDLYTPGKEMDTAALYDFCMTGGRSVVPADAATYDATGTGRSEPRDERDIPIAQAEPREALSQVRALQEDWLEVEQQARTLIEQLTASDTECAKLRSQLETITTERDELTLQLQSTASMCTQLSAGLQATMTTYGEQHTKLQAVQIRCEELEVDVVEVRQTRVSSAVFDALRLQLETTAEERDELRARLEKQLRTSSEAHQEPAVPQQARVADERDELQLQLDASNSERERLGQRLRAATALYDKKCTELEAEQTRYAAMQAEATEAIQMWTATSRNQRARLDEMRQERDWEQSGREEAERRLQQAMQGGMWREEEKETDDESDHQQPRIVESDADEELDDEMEQKQPFINARRMDDM